MKHFLLFPMLEVVAICHSNRQSARVARVSSLLLKCKLMSHNLLFSECVFVSNVVYCSCRL